MSFCWLYYVLVLKIQTSYMFALACVTATVNFPLCHCSDVSPTAKSASKCVYTCALSFLFIVTLYAVHAFHLVHLTPTNAHRHDHRPITRNILTTTLFQHSL